MNNILKYIIHIIFLIGIYGTGALVYQEFLHGSNCPKILDIPACYIILICFVVPYIAHIFKLNNIFYFSGTGLAWSIATYGSIMQIAGVVECPKTSTDIPMCFISFAFFTSLIVLKVIEIRKANTLQKI